MVREGIKPPYISESIFSACLHIVDLISFEDTHAHAQTHTNTHADQLHERPDLYVKIIYS